MEINDEGSDILIFVQWAERPVGIIDFLGLGNYSDDDDDDGV